MRGNCTDMPASVVTVPTAPRAGEMRKEYLMMRFTGAIAVASMAAAIGTSTPIFAQTYPSQQVRIVVPFSPGSATDILARIIGDKLSERWGNTVIVENRPGLAGTTSAAKSTADGYTLMVTSNGHTIAGIINKNLSFDPVKDFVGITPIAAVPLVVIVPPDSPAKTIKEFIDLARANPGKLNFASPGLGSSTFIAGALFKEAAKIDMVHVPYKGAPESVTSVMRGDTQLYFAPINVGAELVVAGKVRALAVATPARNPTMKDVPTMTESGLEFKYVSWYGLLAPAGMPREIVAKVNRDVVDILKLPAIQASLAAQGVEPMPMAADAFDKLIASDTTRLAEIFKDGIK
jgi:tripartite-type tricarboxylate transporter receptor subunit TctC